jgi:hypothetical protein
VPLTSPATPEAILTAIETVQTQAIPQGAQAIPQTAVFKAAE